MDTISLALALLAATPAEPHASPAVLAEAFNDTCRRGFPDVEVVAAHAAASGWTERASRLITQPGQPKPKNIPVPRFLQRGEFMLILMSPSALAPRPSCSVSLRMGKEVDLNSVAAAVTQALGSGSPTMTKINRTDHAQWRPTPSLLVDASIQKGSPRTAHIMVRTAP